MTVHIDAIPEMPDTRKVQQLIRAGVGRAAKGTRTELVRAIRGEVPKMRASKVRGDIQILRGGTGTAATLRVMDKPVSLRSVVRGRPRATTGTATQPGGVRVQIGPNRHLDIPRGFVVGSLSGELFMRRGTARLPIRKLMAPSTRDLAITVWDDVRPKSRERMLTEIRRALATVGFNKG